MVVDLFRGSGNIGHQLGRRLDHRVHAAELDPVVHQSTRSNLDRLGSPVELHLADYRDQLGWIPASSERDTYVVEPPWGATLTGRPGRDPHLPQVPEILHHIRARGDGP
jgi:predicted RNA methylase